jgi:hypothetical protein
MAKSVITGSTQHTANNSESTSGRYAALPQFQEGQEREVTDAAQQRLLDDMSTQMGHAGIETSFAVPDLAPDGEALYKLVSSD